MRYDVAIIGGGPAGAATAGQLAARGAKVVLFDESRFPRPKACGECLNPGAVAVLGRLGLTALIEGLRPAPILGWRLCHDRHRCDLDFPDDRIGAAVDRVRFDHALLQWAATMGATVLESTRVEDLLCEGGRVTGIRLAGRLQHRPVEARVVVGADGLRSMVARRLSLTDHSRHPPRVAFTGHWEGVDCSKGRGEIHFRGRTICGIAPITDGRVNVSLVLPTEMVKGSRDRQAVWLSRWPGLAQRFAVGRPVGPFRSTGPFDRPNRAMHAPGALLVGDAAGYFDPLTGQGIYRALRGSELCSRALVEALEGREEAAFFAYQAQTRAEFAPKVRVQRWIDAAVARGWVLAGAIGALRAFPAGGRWLLGVVGDCWEMEGS